MWATHILKFKQLKIKSIDQAYNARGQDTYLLKFNVCVCQNQFTSSVTLY